MTMSESGYRPCACRDCFEIAIGEAGALCHECDDAGCDPARECQAAGAYGGEEPESYEPGPLTPIHAACERDGLCVVSDGSEHPAEVVPRLVSALRVLDVERRILHAVVGADGAIPSEALADAQHPFWASAEARLVLDALVTALDALAPAGFRFTAEGSWMRLGFFR